MLTPEPKLAGWSRIELARLYGCLHVRYIRMAKTDPAIDKAWNWRECHELGKALERLREAR